MSPGKSAILHVTLMDQITPGMTYGLAVLAVGAYSIPLLLIVSASHFALAVMLCLRSADRWASAWRSRTTALESARKRYSSHAPICRDGLRGVIVCVTYASERSR